MAVEMAVKSGPMILSTRSQGLSVFKVGLHGAGLGFRVYATHACALPAA